MHLLVHILALHLLLLKLKNHTVLLLHLLHLLSHQFLHSDHAFLKTRNSLFELTDVRALLLKKIHRSRRSPYFMDSNNLLFEFLCLLSIPTDHLDLRRFVILGGLAESACAVLIYLDLILIALYRWLWLYLGLLVDVLNALLFIILCRPYLARDGYIVRLV